MPFRKHKHRVCEKIDDCPTSLMLIFHSYVRLLKGNLWDVFSFGVHRKWLWYC